MNDLEKAARDVCAHLLIHADSGHKDAHMFCKDSPATADRPALEGCATVFMRLIQAVEDIDINKLRMEYPDDGS